MKKLIFLFILFLNVYYIKGQNVTNCSSNFVFEQTTITDDNNNEIDLVLIELEDVPNQSNLSGWEFRNTNLKNRDGNLFPTPFSGDGFLYYVGSNFFIDGGNNVVEYRIKITNPGTYRFVYSTAIGIFATDAPPSTEHNDAWVKFPDADAFFGYRDNTNTIVIPNNEGVNQNNPDPNDPQLESDYPGATYKLPVNSSKRNKGFFKVYMNQLDDWWYEGATSDEDAHKVYIRFDSPGTYTMQISGRSDGFAMDRAVLYKEEGDFANLNGRNDRKDAFKNLSSAIPICLDNPSNFNGNKFSSTSVALSWTDDYDDEISYEIEASHQSGFSEILNTQTLDANTTQTVLGGLEEGKTYFFRIRAKFSSDTYSEYSEVIEITTNIKPTLDGTIELEVVGNSFLQFPKELFTQSFSDPDGDTVEKIKITSLPEGFQNFEILNLIDPIVVDSEFNVDQIETNNEDIQFRYKALDDFTGKTSFTFTASDGFDFAEISQTVHITVLKPQIQITLDGNIIGDEQDINFGQVQAGDSISKTFIIKNTGNLDLSLTNLPLEITDNIDNDYVIEQQPLQSVLAAGESTDLVVKFKPSSVGELKNAQIVVSNNDFDNVDQDFRIDFSGEGVFIGDPPEIISASSISISENVLDTVYTAVANENVNFSLGNSNDEPLFFITDGANGSEVTLNFIVSPDFETPGDSNQDNVYLVELIVTDTDGNIISQVVSITVTDILDETPPQITSGSSTSLAENTSGAIYVATANEQVSFSLGNDKDEAFFTLNNDELSFIEAPDFESPLDQDTDNIYLVDLIATDASNNIATLEISITVTNILDETLPQITSGSSTAVKENTSGKIYTATANKQVSFSLGNDKDEAFFTLNNDELNFIDAPDFESPLDQDTDNIYLVDLIATDASNNIATLEISITVTNILDETLPQITSGSSTVVEENTSGAIYVATANEQVSFSLGIDKDEAFFTLNNDELSFIEAPDFESPSDENMDNVYLLDLIATDAGGNITTEEISITVTDIIDETLLQITSGSSMAVEENTSGIIYTATANKQVSFSLGIGKDEEYFALNNNELSFVDAPDFESPLDVNLDNVYLIDLIATDTDGNSTLKEVSITVTNIDDTADSGPKFISVSEITAVENITGVFYTIETDISTTLSLGTENDEELFRLANGELSFKESPDFESPIDKGGDNTYVVQVIAEDVSGNISSLLLSVTVLDVNDEVLSIPSIENEISVYPNPTSKKLFIDSSNIGKVLFMDIKGNTVFKSESTHLIDVENIPTGVYSLIIETAEGIFTKRIIIAR